MYDNGGGKAAPRIVEACVAYVFKKEMEKYENNGEQTILPKKA